MVQASKMVNPARKCQRTDVFSPGGRFPWFELHCRSTAPSGVQDCLRSCGKANQIRYKDHLKVWGQVLFASGTGNKCTASAISRTLMQVGPRDGATTSLGAPKPKPNRASAHVTFGRHGTPPYPLQIDSESSLKTELSLHIRRYTSCFNARLWLVDASLESSRTIAAER